MPSLPAGFRPLRHGVFARFWAAGAVSDIGTWVQLVAMSNLVAGSSATAPALVVAATFGPQGLGSPIGGLLADRHDRRKLFLLSLAGQTVATAVLCFLLANGVRNTTVLTLVVFLQSGAGSLGAPSFQAIIPDLVPKEELVAATSLGLLGWNTGRVVGPLLAGAAAIAGVSPAWAIGVNALSFAALWAAVFTVRRSFPPANIPGASRLKELRSGAAMLWRTPGTRFVLLMGVLMNMTVVPFMGLIAPMAKQVLHKGDEVTALLNACQGVAGLTGALLTASLVTRFGRSRLLPVCMVAEASSLTVFATSASVAQAIVGVMLSGFFIVIIFGMVFGITGRDAPAKHRGRIMSLNQATQGLGYGAAVIAYGRIVDATTFATPFLFGASAFALGAFFIANRRRIRAVIDGSDQAPRSKRVRPPHPESGQGPAGGPGRGIGSGAGR